MDICGDGIDQVDRRLDALRQLDEVQNGNDLPSDNVNISDVLEVLERDPACVAADVAAAVPQAPAMGGASVDIVEQPAPKALRFRYECEGRSAGSIPGVNSTSENRTYPTIRINNYIGQVTIVVSCVTKDEPYKAHPHNLVGRERCERGVCTIRSNITAEASEYQFKNLGIQCVKRRDIADALQTRSQLRVDPFRQGFDHRNNPQSIDLNAVRLAFQVFLHEGNSQRMYQLPAVASDIIFDKKAMCDLQIMRSSHCSGTVAGGTQIILLCEKVSREDTVVEFYQEDSSGRVLWSAVANPVYVHRLVALVVETPRYNPSYYDPRTHRGQITVRFHLRRLTDKQCSNSLPFEYIPDFQDSKKRKAVMPAVINYDERCLQPPIKMEPNRTPPHHTPSQAYSPQGPGYPEPQWAPLEALGAGAGAGAGAAGAMSGVGAWGAYPAPAYGAPSPLGALSPHNNLQSPISPTHAPVEPYHQPAPYQMEPMDASGASLSALLNVGADTPLQPELFSISSLMEGDRENLSESLRQLSTNDLFQQ